MSSRQGQLANDGEEVTKEGPRINSHSAQQKLLKRCDSSGSCIAPHSKAVESRSGTRHEAAAPSRKRPIMSIFNANSGPPVVPEEERDPPPPPTLVYFPQNDLDEHTFKTDDEWVKHVPDLFRQYCRIAKPQEVSFAHLRALNISVRNDVDLQDLLPVTSDGIDYLPQSVLPSGSRRNSTQQTPRVSAEGTVPPHVKQPLLSNGHKAPDTETYTSFARELACDNDDAFRVLQRRKPRTGRTAPRLGALRSFWTQLETVARHWDTSLDHYYEVASEPTSKSPAKPAKGLKRLGLALRSMSSESLPETHKSGKRYKGQRTSTGSKMPDQFRIDMIRHLVEPIAWAFGCRSMIPKRVPQMEIGGLRLPVTQTAVIWRHSKDKASSKRGITEGPLLGVQCRGETGFVKGNHTAALDAAREIAGVLLLAEERAREGRSAVLPGVGQWYTSKPRWGGGPGGAFGDTESHADRPPVGRRHSMPLQMPPTPVQRQRTEEEIWRELKPGQGLFDSTHTYLAVGKDRSEQSDTAGLPRYLVFMISSLFHHLSILKLTVHPIYVDYLISGKLPQNLPPDSDWCRPTIDRSRWYDLLVPAERSEALRGIWGVMSYLMRSGENVTQSYGQRQKSDSQQHHFSFRRKSLELMTPGKAPPRSHSVAF